MSFVGSEPIHSQNVQILSRIVRNSHKYISSGPVKLRNPSSS